MHCQGYPVKQIRIPICQGRTVESSAFDRGRLFRPCAPTQTTGIPGRLLTSQVTARFDFNPEAPAHEKGQPRKELAMTSATDYQSITRIPAATGWVASLQTCLNA